MNESLEKQELQKGKLSLIHIWAIGVGAVVGDGIFLLIGEGGAIAGPLAIIAYFAAGVLLSSIVISFGDMAVGMPSAGALWVWVRRTLGDFPGYMAGTTYATGWIVAGGSTSIAIGIISTGFFQITADYNTSVFIWAVIWASVFTVINYVGVGLTGKTQTVLVLILVALMGGFGIIGIVSGKMNYSNFSPFAPYGAKSFFPALAYGTYAYMGTVTLATSGSECKNPKDLPKGLVLASLTFLIMYTLAMIAMFGILHYTEMGVLESPFVAAAQRAFGPATGVIVNFAAWLAAATCLLGGTFYSAPRTLYAMAKEGVLPESLAKLNKNHAPSVATILVYIISIILCIIGLWAPGRIFVELSTLVVSSWLLCEFLGIIGGIRYRLSFKEEIEKLPWKQPLFPLFPILGIIGSGVIFYGSFVGAFTSVVVGLGWFLLLAIYYCAYGKNHMLPMKSDW